MKFTRGLVLGVSALLLALSSPVSHAAPLELIYTGVLNSQNSLTSAAGVGGAFTAPTPFTINAWFDTSSPNLAPPSPPLPPPFAGFRAYEPSLATISIAGVTYTMETISQNPTAGVTVAIFDANSFEPGRYGVGILQQPPADGAGIIGDFTGASPDFSASNIVPTVFTGYYGVGYGSGVCLQGTGGNCQLNAVPPFVLRDPSGRLFSLTLGNFEEDYPTVHEAGSGSIVGPLNTAQLVATPEPATIGLTLSALIGCAVMIRKRK